MRWHGQLMFSCIVVCLMMPGLLHADQEKAYSLTGDKIAGVPVIDALNAAALPMGAHQYYFRAGTASNGQPLDVPVLVLRGASSGKRLLLTAAVHGDELNGIAVIHQLFSKIAPEDLIGTLIAVPGVNQTGMVANRREFMSSGRGPSTDLNRIFPGKLNAGTSADRYVGALWHQAFKNNADLAVDIHTQTTGSSYPLFVFADFKNIKAKAMAFALMPDLIKDDEGQKGTLETTFMKANIPAVTLEVGGPKAFDQNLIDRATAGLMNLMRTHHMLDGPSQSADTKPFVGTKHTNVPAQEAGTVHLKVALLDRVEKQQLIAIMVDPFGKETRRYFAPHAGIILSVATDPLREAGATLVRILY